MHWNFNSYLITGYGRGRIICGDIGQHSVQVLKGIKKGGNYGWNVDEGGKPMCKECDNGMYAIQFKRVKQTYVSYHFCRYKYNKQKQSLKMYTSSPIEKN